jgi:hypothetical protein
MAGGKYRLYGRRDGAAHALASRMPKLAEHAALLRKRPATIAAERDHAED